MDTAGRYELFAEYEARGNSSCYERWCAGIAADPGLIGVIDQLPPAKRQPNLVLAAARYLGAPISGFPVFRQWLLEHWDSIRDVALSHSTQTNECGRAAVLLPVLASLPGPLWLIEVGASAGLCLYPDRFSYRYTADDDDVRPRPVLNPSAGPSAVVLTCAVSGEPPIPHALPTVIHRAGVDLNPLDIDSPDDMCWLESLIWPGQSERLQRLRGAAEIARHDRPHISTGDLTSSITGLVHAAPSGTVVVVFGSAVLNYLQPAARRRFEDTVRALPCHWISNEGAGVVESVIDRLPKPLTETRGEFVITLDDTPLAYAGGHGQSLDWFAG